MSLWWKSFTRSSLALLGFGLLAFVLAGLSVAVVFLPRPFDGVVLDTDVTWELRVREVLPGSGAARGGIQPGDRIVGIGRSMVDSPQKAAGRLSPYTIGDQVPYLVETDHGRERIWVELGRRSLGSPEYLYACALGFAFFFVGLFVLVRQPALRPAQVFFVLSTLFMLFLICRLRPASYSQVDSFLLATGTAALLFLPATFLHFFLIFPRPLWRRAGGPDSSGTRTSSGAVALPLRLRTALDLGFGLMYLVPPLALLASALLRSRDRDLAFISGAPLMSWWILAAYMLLGLTALAINARRLPDARERRGALLVFFGSLFGLVPFLVLAVGFPSVLHTEKFLFYGVIPLVLVPLTFAYAIVRFQLLDIRVILRKSLLYTATTAVVTGLYALGIALFNTLTRGSALADSPYFPLVFALVIVLLFEPLRQRLQEPVDRFFFAERSQLQKAMVDLGEALNAEPDLEAVVRDLMDKLPRLLGLDFAALYLLRAGRLERVAGPPELPVALPRVALLHEELRERGSLARLERLALGSRSRGGTERGGSSEPADQEALLDLLRHLERAEVEVIGDLSSPRRWIGVVLLSRKVSQMAWEREELDLLRGLLHQTSMALETSLLLEERTRQAELERELEIAAAIQQSLLPSAVTLGPGWEVEAACRPARHVGGDFIAELSGPDGHRALAYGDVSGKSVSGALVMMAAYEVLNSLALTARDPEELLDLANQRLYRLGNKRFVALGYFASERESENGSGRLSYVLAGQPEPLKKHLDGSVTELELPEHRLPLGALTTSRYQKMEVPVLPGELILGYSDGVVEARSPRGEFFGVRRLTEVLEQAPNEPREVVRRVLEAVDRFTHGQEPYDDLTLIVLRRQREESP